MKKIETGGKKKEEMKKKDMARLENHSQNNEKNMRDQINRRDFH